VRILLDTHVFLWMVYEPERLGALEPSLVDTGSQLVLSAVVTWELAIKQGLGRLGLPQPPGQLVTEQLSRLALTPLVVDHRHAAAVADLPDHHRDPFDRMLVAQAAVEELLLRRRTMPSRRTRPPTAPVSRPRRHPCPPPCVAEIAGSPARERPRGRLTTPARSTMVVGTQQWECMMTESVYKVIELVGSSTESWEKAAEAAVNQAGASLRNLRVAEVVELDMALDDEGAVKAYRAKVSVSFKTED